jgi:DNA-binding transcriptional regulator YiaG
MPNLHGRHDLQGYELKGIRQALHLTQSELAKLIGVTVSTVAALERGEGRISGPTFKLLELLTWLPDDQRREAIARLVTNPHTTPT